MTEQTSTRTPRAIWICYAAGIVAYIVAVFNRSSFGVAATPAAARFEASASDIAFFTVVQLVVYAGLQIPVGAMIDRFGPRRLVISGCFIMAVGQLYLAFATSITPALLARMLIGAGDALIFTSVIRMAAGIFPAHRVPMMQQWAGLTGQIGQIMSAIPFAALLQMSTWTISFLVVAAHGVIGGVVAFLFFRIDDEEITRGRAIPPRDMVRQIAAAWRHPGTRLGFWSHFTPMFSVTTFGMLWGFPFMTQGLDYDLKTASGLLTLSVIVSSFASPLIGRTITRHPLRRSTLVLSIVAMCIAAWTLVLLWPGRTPTWVLLIMIIAISIGGPGSMAGYDFARTFNPSSRLGSATGIVNVGGFVASFAAMFLIGVILDWTSTGSHGEYSLSSFKWAFTAQYLIWAVGIFMMVRTRNQTRRILHTEGIVVPPLREALRRDWDRYRAKREVVGPRRPIRRREKASDEQESAPDDPVDWQI